MTIQYTIGLNFNFDRGRPVQVFLRLLTIRYVLAFFVCFRELRLCLKVVILAKRILTTVMITVFKKSDLSLLLG